MSRTRTLWDEGHEPGRRVVALAVAVALTAVLLDLSLLGQVSLLFDLVFVALCVGMALLVRPADFFVVGVLPPLLLLAVFVALSFTHREAIADPTDGAVQAVVSGLSRHSVALGLGYGLCLGVLGIRDRWAARGATRGLTGNGPGRPLPSAASAGSPGTSRRPWSAPRGSRRPR